MEECWSWAIAYRLSGVLERQDCTEPRIMALAVAARA